MTSSSASAVTGSARTLRRVAVCGAGVMGAQIAAHCVNAGIPVVLFDLPAREGPKMALPFVPLPICAK